MAVRGAIDPAGQPAVVKAGVFRRFGRAMVLAAATLAAALLMSPTASAQLYTSTSGTEYWTSARWASGTSGPFTSNWVSGSNTNFATAGTYTFGRLASSGTETLGDITTGTGVFISFNESGTSQGGNLNFGGAGGQVKTLAFGAGSVVDFGSIVIAANNGNGITKNGAGTLVLTGGDYKGGFTLNAGNVLARSGTAFGTKDLTINGGAIGSGTTTYTAVARTGTISVGGDFQIGIADGLGVNSANMTFSASGNGLNLTGSARTITLGSSGSMTFGQSISNGSLTLNRLAGASAGQFGLSGANTISALTLDGVTVNASTQNTVLGAGTVTLTGSNATTLNIRSAQTLANNFTIADSAGIKTIANTVGGNSTISGTITNNDSTAGDFVIGATNGRTLTIGAIDGTGGVTFGGGTLVGTVAMTGTGTYAGNTVIDGSILSTRVNGRVAPTNVVFQRTSGAVSPTFDLYGTTQTVAGLDDSAFAGIIRSTLANGKLIVGDSNDSTFQGTIISGDSLALEKVGSGKLTLTGANTFTNGTTITAGELAVSSQSLKGDVMNNGTLTFNQSFGDGTFSGNISGSGSFFKDGDDTLTLSGANSYGGGTTVTGGTLIGDTDALQGEIVNNATVTFRQNVDGTYSGEMSGAGALVKEGAGNVTLSGANTYAAGTTITAGTLALGSADAIGSSGTISFGGGTLRFSENNTTDYSARFSNAASQQVKIDTDGQNVVLASNLTSSGGSFEKLGLGTVTLSGTNTYSGGTAVSAGSLLVNGSLANSAVTVGNGGTLGGSGSLGALLTVQSGGVLSPGNSPGVLAAAALDLQAGSTTFIEIAGSGLSAVTAGTDYDQIRITTATENSLTYGGELVLSFINDRLFDNGTMFSLFSFTGTARGAFTEVRTEGSGSYSGLTLQYNANGSWYSHPDTAAGQYLVFSPASGRLAIVPEPSTWVMAAIGAGLVALKARRRKRAEASRAQVASGLARSAISC
jgi:autotransporter-associated beta strand protein